MKKLAGILALLSLGACADIEDFFLGGGRLDNEGTYTFAIDNLDDLIFDSSMIFTEEEYTLVEMTTTDDQGEPALTYALYLGDPANIATDTVIVYCHGNGGTVESAFRRATAIANVGGKGRYGVLIPEYLGFGLAQGGVSEENMYRGVDAGVSWLESQGLTSDRLVYYGVSLGSVSSVGLTADPRALSPHKLMLEAPIAGVATLSQDVVGLALPASFFTSENPMDNLSKMERINQPVLIIHGDKDNYIDYESNGIPLFEAYQGSAGTFYTVIGANHVNVPETMGFTEYERVLLDFITQ